MKNVLRSGLLKTAISFLLLLILYGAVSATVMDRFMRENGSINQNRGGGFDKYLQHQMKRPFAYRILLPSIVDAIEPSITSNLTESLKHKFTSGTPLREYMKIGQDEPIVINMSVRYHIGYFISFLSLIGLAFLLRALALSVTPDDINLANFAPVAFITLLPITFLHGGFLYDFPELFLLALSFLFIIKHRILALCLVLPLAILNKESNILIPFIYAAYAWEEIPVRTGLKRVLALTLVASISYVFGQYLTQESGGVMVMNHFSQNLEFMGSPESWFLWFRAYGGLIPFPRGYNILLIAMISFVIMSAWRFSHPGTRRVFIFIFVINLYLVLAHGNRDEMRNWSLLFLPLYLLAIGYLSTQKQSQRQDSVDHI